MLSSEVLLTWRASVSASPMVLASSMEVELVMWSVETGGRDASVAAAFLGGEGAFLSGIGHAWALVVDMAFRRWTRSSWC
jgi:hypothetical protein